MPTVAYDYHIFSQQCVGGISRYFCEIASRADRGHEWNVNVIAPIHFNDHLATTVVKTIGIYAPKGIPKTGWLYRGINAAVSPTLLTMIRPDIIHHTYYCATKKPAACRSIVTVHDMIHELFVGRFSKNDRTSALKRQAIDQADHVICVSESTRGDLLKLFKVPEAKVSVVHHGFEKFSKVKSCPEYISNHIRPYLLYVGVRGGYKNFDGILRAIASSRRLKEDFDIVAFGGGKFNGAENSLISKLQFKPAQVTQACGDDETLARFYSQATAFVYPSLYEGFGLPPLEAMAYRCPVISSNTSSMPEVIGKAGEFFNPVSIDDIAAAIEQVVYSPTRTQELIELGCQRLKLFSWDRCTERTLDVYKAVIST
jgi:glycosyltransferase involved in cell wall biosynthesis